MKSKFADGADVRREMASSAVVMMDPTTPTTTRIVQLGKEECCIRFRSLINKKTMLMLTDGLYCYRVTSVQNIFLK